MSIALALFCFLRSAHVILHVQTIAETRRQRLQILLDREGTLADLNEKLELSRTDATLSQIKNQSKHHKTGKPRSMGDDLARRIELTLGLPEGWMDTPPTEAEIHGDGDPRSKAAALLDAMDSEQLYTAVRLLDAIAQPAKSNGTTGH